jgi:hypothetical protein
MSNPVAFEYWRSIQDGWSQSVEEANDGHANRSVTVKERRSVLSAERIVVTGMRGAGKSVIYKALVGLIDERYRKTSESKRVEGHKVRIAKDRTKIRAKISVLPGQRDSPPRCREVERVFKHGNYPVGVVHVVCWGFDEVWDHDARPGILRSAANRRKPADLGGVSAYLRTTQELEDFTRTIRLLKDAWEGRTDEIWFIIAVTKCDLYWDQIWDVGKYYIPGSAPDVDSPFGKELRSLMADLEFPKFAVLPVSCVSDPFDFSGGLRADSGKFEDNWRVALISRLVNKIGEFNGA